MSIDVGVNALRSRFMELQKFSQSGTGPGAYLLRFYAVECGLKAAILRRRKVRSTAQLPENLRTHDLHVLAAELKLSAADVLGLKSCQRKDIPTVLVRPHQVHEAWRYGATLLAGAEADFVGGLDKLIAWCRKELSS